jgi:hypothetical protein
VFIGCDALRKQLMGANMKQALNLRHRLRKSRITLLPITFQQQESLETKPLQKTSVNKKTFVCLRFLWEQKYISLEDYLTACKYIELSTVIQRISGGPKGFNYRVAWHNRVETSHVSWIQSELSLLDQNHFSSCRDEEVLELWKILQRTLHRLPLSLRCKFNQLLFEENIPKFHEHLRVYIKAFQKAIPAIKIFMIAFWKQKSPH